MKLKNRFLSTCLCFIALLSAGCVSRQQAYPPTSTGTTLPSPVLAFIPEGTVSPFPESTPTIESTSITLQTPDPRATPRAVNMNLAVLNLEDFPADFQALDRNGQERIGFTPELLARLFDGIFKQAVPLNSFAFQNGPGKTFEVVIGVVFYPLTLPEQATLDHILADPETAMQNFSQGFSGKAQLVADLNRLAQTSVGWSFLSGSGSGQLKAEMVIFRRSETAALVMVLYPADKAAPAGLTTLASRLDYHIRQGLGEID